MNYTKPPAHTLGNREQADRFVKTMEDFLNEIDEKTHTMIQQRLHTIPLEIKDELKHDLVTRELFMEKMDHIDERFTLQNTQSDEKFTHLEIQFNEKVKGLALRLNIFLAIALAALTFANPVFVKLLEKLLRI